MIPNKEEEAIEDSEAGVTLEEDQTQVGQKKLSLQITMEAIRVEVHFRWEDSKEEDLLGVGFSQNKRIIHYTQVDAIIVTK